MIWLLLYVKRIILSGVVNMGWTSYHATFYKNGTVDRKAEIDNMWNNDASKKFEVLKSTMRGSVYYGAIKREERVFAVIFLTSVDSKDYFNFSYKDMDETVCPYQYDCPISILKLLSKTDNEYALEWRKKCYEKHSHKKEEANNPYSLKNLPIGTQISFIAKYETNANNAEDEITLTKVADYNGKAYWYGCGYKWNEKIIKNISDGEYKVKQKI